MEKHLHNNVSNMKAFVMYLQKNQEAKEMCNNVLICIQPSIPEYYIHIGHSSSVPFNWGSQDVEVGVVDGCVQLYI